MMAQRIGLSLSMCVQDIINGLVSKDDVICIISNTRIRNESDLRYVCNSYAREYWRLDAWSAFEITKELYANGKLLQPRLNDEQRCHQIRTGHWLEIE